MATIVRGALIVTPEGSGVRAERGTISIDADRIRAVAYGADAVRVPVAPADRVIDASRRVAVPGLVDAHAHSYGTLAPGLVDHIPLDIRMLALSATLTGWTERDSRVGTLIGAWRMLRGGTTTVNENVLQGLDGTEPAIRAFLDAGMRAVVGPMIADRPFHETLPGYLDHLPEPWRAEALATRAPDGKALVAASVDLARRWDGAGGRIRVCLSPSTPHRSTDELLRLVAEASATHGFSVHTHLLETRVQAVAGRRIYGRSMVEHIRELGLLSPRLSCAHSVWLDDRELDLLADGGAGVSHNPLSNLYLGSGIARVPQLLRRGVPVGLGSDGPNCGASMPLFEIMKLAACVHRIGEVDGDQWVSARDAFRMATIGGARALGLDRDVGSIEVGKKADLVLIDADAPSLVPLNDPLRQLVYGENGGGVDTVIVDGEVVVERGRPTRFDPDALLAEARECGARVLERAQPALERARTLQPYLKAAYLSLLGTDAGGRS
jgi:cytosine/adenosine deaminase-related metal-dependent hydrolase